MGSERFVVVEFNGSGTLTVGFVEGFRLGRDPKAPVWFAGREELGLDGFLTKLREALKMEVHAVMTDQLADGLKAALADAPLVDLEITDTREVTGASLPFKFKCFSRDAAGEIRRILQEDIPEGVLLEDYREEEKVNPDAKGVELYAPTHEYTFEGKGIFRGDIAGIIEVAHQLAEDDFISASKIQLDTD